MKHKYENMDGIPNTKSWREMRQWQKERRSKRKDLSYRVPAADSIRHDLLGARHAQTTVTWIGHSTFLIQYGRLNIVTDPVWASRMGFQKRLSPPGIPIGELPPVDVVLLSHNHYDHLHYRSIRRLKGEPVCLIPKGLEAAFRRKGFRQVEPFVWWESRVIKGIQFTFVPAQHWSRRGIADTNASLWGGWVIEKLASEDKSSVLPLADKPIYFAGDSGYFRGFREIGSRFAGGIGAALLPIGAYEPEWFMGPQHTTPEEAVAAFADLRAELFVPMHYGAFRLADDTPKEALDRLTAAWTAQALPECRLAVPRQGETLLL